MGLIDLELGFEAGTHSSATDGTHLTDISGTYLSAMSGILLAIYSRIFPGGSAKIVNSLH